MGRKRFQRSFDPVRFFVPNRKTTPMRLLIAQIVGSFYLFQRICLELSFVCVAPLVVYWVDNLILKAEPQFFL